MSNRHNRLRPIISEISNETFIDASSWVTKSNKLSNELKMLNSRIARDSYFDFLEINNEIGEKLIANALTYPTEKGWEIAKIIFPDIGDYEPPQSEQESSEDQSEDK